jgi:hypothetical protein
MPPSAPPTTRGGRAELGAVYRLLASELAAIKAKHAANGTTPVDETGAAAGGTGGGHRGCSTGRDLPT